MKKGIMFLMITAVFIWGDESRVHKVVFDLSNGNPMVIKGRVAWNIRTISKNLQEQNRTLSPPQRTQPIFERTRRGKM
jgi:hypothetical protein